MTFPSLTLPKACPSCGLATHHAPDCGAVAVEGPFDDKPPGPGPDGASSPRIRYEQATRELHAIEVRHAAAKEKWAAALRAFNESICGEP